MKKIQVKNSVDILVDDEFYQLTASYKWNICKSRDKQYARATIYHPKKKDIYLHHLILGGLKSGHSAYFIDGNTLNCQENNIIQVPFHTKSHIKKCTFLNKTSMYRGVFLKFGMFISAITYMSKTSYLGVFKTEKEAAIAYDLKAIELYKEFAKTNIMINPYFLS